MTFQEIPLIKISVGVFLAALAVGLLSRLYLEYLSGRGGMPQIRPSVSLDSPRLILRSSVASGAALAGGILVLGFVLELLGFPGAWHTFGLLALVVFVLAAVGFLGGYSAAGWLLRRRRQRM